MINRKQVLILVLAAACAAGSWARDREAIDRQAQRERIQQQNRESDRITWRERQAERKREREYQSERAAERAREQKSPQRNRH